MNTPKTPLTRISDAETTQQKIWLGLVSFLRSTKFLWFYFCIPAAFLSVGYVLFHMDEMDAQSFFTYGGNFYTTMGLLVTLLYLRRVSRRAGKPLIQGMPKFWRDVDWKKSGGFFLFGMTTAWALSFLLTLLERIAPGLMAGYAQDSMEMYSALDLGMTVATTVLLCPIVEEVVFRGHMLDVLLETFEERGAIVVCTLTFAVFHGNLIWAIYAGIMGFLLAYVSIREEGIFEVVLMHIGFNAPSAIIVLTSQRSGGAMFDDLFFMVCLGGISACVSVILAKQYAKSQLR